MYGLEKNISWITECTYSDPYYSNVEHMVYKKQIPIISNYLE